MRIPGSETAVVIQAASRQDSMVFELTPELASAIRRTAHQRGTTPQELLQELLPRALRQEQQRAHAQVRLSALTDREREVTQLAGLGCTNREIAERLVISPETVKTHIRHILAKLNLDSKLELRMLLGGEGSI